MNRNTIGFTLLEMLLVLMLLALLSVASLPCLMHISETIEGPAVLRQIANEIYLARSVAIKGQTNTQYCGLKSTWEKERFIRGPNNQLLVRFGPLPQRYTLKFFNSLGKNSCLTFVAMGFTNSEYARFMLITGTTVRYLTVTLSGRLRLD